MYIVPASGACFSISASAETLEARLAGGRIHVTAPRLHFITGKPLERLRNGAPVPFAMQLTLSTDRWTTISQRDIERFVFSYDVWEEKFRVSKLGSPQKVISHLTATAAESWCVDEMTVPPAGMPDQQPFWLRLEVRAETPGEDTSILTDEGVSLSRLVELFSRRARTDQTRWATDAGPFRLAELGRPARGASR
jgi:hypothetical protein